MCTKLNISSIFLLILFIEIESYAIEYSVLMKLVSCRSKIGINSIKKCIEESNHVWNIQTIDDNDLIIYREYVCCAQWDSYDCRINLAKSKCDKEEVNAMTQHMDRVVIMNERTLCSDYKYLNNKCHQSFSSEASVR
jgi:hypothetical protein